MRFLFLPMCLLGSQAFAQITVQDFVALDRPNTYDGMVIGKALSPAEIRSLPSRDRGDLPARKYFVQRVLVEDATRWKAGTTVNVFLPYGYESASAVLPLNGRVLILGAASGSPDDLRVPRFNAGPEPDEHFRTPIGSSLNLTALAFFETSHSRLASEGEPVWRMLTSVAESLHGSSDQSVVNAESFLENCRMPNWNYPLARTDDRFSRLFVDAVKADRAYHRALIDLALNSLYYVGYRDRYFADLYESVTDPRAFPEGVPTPSYCEQPQNGERGVPKDFRHDQPPTLERWMEMLKTATSPTVIVWMIQGLDRPADADLRWMARYLDCPDVRLRYAFVNKLSTWFGEPALDQPTAVFSKGKVAEAYPGLEEAVARWKTRLRTD